MKFAIACSLISIMLNMASYFLGFESAVLIAMSLLITFVVFDNEE